MTCKMCDGTGYKDNHGFRMELCDCPPQYAYAVKFYYYAAGMDDPSEWGRCVVLAATVSDAKNAALEHEAYRLEMPLSNEEKCFLKGCMKIRRV